MNFIKMVLVHHSSNIKIIRSDNGHEFIMPNFYDIKELCIKPVLNLPKNNGKVKIKHQHILNIVRVVLYEDIILKVF